MRRPRIEKRPGQTSSPGVKAARKRSTGTAKCNRHTSVHPDRCPAHECTAPPAGTRQPLQHFRQAVIVRDHRLRRQRRHRAALRPRSRPARRAPRPARAASRSVTVSPTSTARSRYPARQGNRLQQVPRVGLAHRQAVRPEQRRETPRPAPGPPSIRSSASRSGLVGAEPRAASRPAASRFQRRLRAVVEPGMHRQRRPRRGR